MPDQQQPAFVQEQIPPASPPEPFRPAPEQPVAPPSHPAMPKRFSSTQLLKWLILVAAGLFVVSVFSFWFSSPSFSDRNVDVTLEGPQQATSGDEVTYTLKYANRTKLPLREFSIRFFYPDNSIVVKDGTAESPDSDGVTIDALAPGESGEKTFTMFLVGDKGSIKTAKTTVIFRAGTIRSQFQKQVTATTAITALPVTLTLGVPPDATNGQTIQYQLDYRNETTSDMSDLKIEFAYPDGFVPQSFSPTPDQGSAVWNIPILRTGKGGRIVVTGTLNGAEGDAKTVAVVLKRRLNNQYVDYVRAEWATLISSPLLSVNLSANGSADYVAYPGDTLNYTVAWRNASQFDLFGLTLGVKLEGDMYDLATVNVRDGFFDSSTNTVLYTSSGIPALADAGPGAHGTTTFQVRLKSGVSGGQGGARTFFVKATARLATSNVPTGVDGREVAAQTSLTTKIGSQPTLAQPIYYNDPQFGSSGPLPMQVGQKTMFTVHWQLTNPGNAVGGARVVATLPPGVSFEQTMGATAGDSPVFDRNRNTVTWTIGTVPYGTGVGTSKYEAVFRISVTPSSNQSGQALPLLSGVRFEGTDTFTQQVISVPLSDARTTGIVDRPDDGRVQ